MIRYVLLDLDNTLYPKSSGLGRFIGDRMGEYVIRHLRIPADQAIDLRKEGMARHGTTLRWLVEEHGLEAVEEFIDYVHPKNMDEFLTPNDRERARKVLSEIDLPASILTNAPLEHAHRVLDWLGIRDRFEHIFDIRFNSFAGKPAGTAYVRALEVLNRSASETLFADDMLQYLLPFRDLGGHPVHIAPEPAGEPGIVTISSISELAGIVTQLRSA